jgi:hypothetical protein
MFGRELLLGRQVPVAFIRFPFFSFQHANVCFFALWAPVVLTVLRLSPHGIQHPWQNKAAPERDFDFSRAPGNCLALSHIVT